MSIDLDAIRARVDAAEAEIDRPWSPPIPDDVLASWCDIPALLALVDAQAARIDKALAECDRIDNAPVSNAALHTGARAAIVAIRRALTEDVTA